MKKEKTKYEIIIPLIIFFIISVISIFSASLSINSKQIVTKQVIWYLIGFIILIITPKKIINKIIDNSFIFYLIGNVFLLLLLSNRIFYLRYRRFILLFLPQNFPQRQPLLCCRLWNADQYYEPVWNQKLCCGRTGLSFYQRKQS